jgi:hypothetical protein
VTLRIVNAFRGEVPLLPPRALPDNAAQEAVNARLYTGDLTAFKQFSTTHGLANPGTVRTIALLKDWWMSWESDVDVARGVVPGDTTYRTYLTGLDKPRFTNLDLATGAPNGSAPEPYPFETRLLGVPPPDSPPTTVTSAGANPDVDTTDNGSQFSSWTASGLVQVPGVMSSSATTNASVGNPAPSYELFAANNVSAPAFLYRDFGVGNSAAVDFESQVAFDGNGAVLGCAWTIATTSSGAGCVVSVGYTQGAAAGPFLSIGTKSSWSDPGSWLVQEPIPLLNSNHTVWYQMSITLVRNADGTSTVTATFGGSIGTATLTSNFAIGGYCGFNIFMGFPPPAIAAYLDNIEVKGSGAFADTATTTATNYVYTFVNDFSEESAPSLPSPTILRPDGVSVTITTPTSEPTGIDGDYHITTKRIYRAATGSTGTAYRFVAEIPLSQADYVDTLTDAELGEVLSSDNWALPPDDLEGILALPNGVMAGFRRNQLCFSVQNRPHAWPVEYRLNTDTDIVGIGNIDTTVVIGTKSFLYTASGNDPAAYSMSKFEVPYAASSKRSFAYVTGLGVVFSGPDGLMASAGPGQPRNLTQSVFTRRQWQALDPTSIRSVSHNDIYFMFWESASSRGCYAVDLRSAGFGIVQMAFHASAAYVDPIEDKMYLVLDYVNEPDDEALPEPASPPPYVDGRTIYEFEGSPDTYMNYRWRSKLYLMEYPGFYPIAQVRRASDADGTQGNLVARFYGDGVLLDEIVIDGDVEFTLTPPDAAYSKFFMELTGTDPINVLQAADDVTELN